MDNLPLHSIALQIWEPWAHGPSAHLRTRLRASQEAATGSRGDGPSNPGGVSSTSSSSTTSVYTSSADTRIWSIWRTSWGTWTQWWTSTHRSLGTTDRSRKSLPPFKRPSTHHACGILDMRQLLKKLAQQIHPLPFATWKGDAQRYWSDQVVETARVHEQWLLIPESVNTVESVVWTELLDTMPKTMADACMPYGYCTAKLIMWYIISHWHLI